jgi:hypothetical protein
VARIHPNKIPPTSPTKVPFNNIPTGQKYRMLQACMYTFDWYSTDNQESKPKITKDSATATLRALFRLYSALSWAIPTDSVNILATRGRIQAKIISLSEPINRNLAPRLPKCPSVVTDIPVRKEKTTKVFPESIT